jgi:thioester reductase-like protein
MAPEVAIGSGYGESKYVCEQLLVKASELGLQTTSFRIGQITGGTENGAWATTDWFPILVKSSIALGCLPEAYGTASWVPFSAVAQTILDVATIDGPPERALNVVHPHPVAWRDIVENVADVLVDSGIAKERLPIVLFSEWHAKLRAASERTDESVMTDIPAIKLAEFFMHQAMSDDTVRAEGRAHAEAGGLSVLSTIKAQLASPTLRNLPTLRKEDVERWVAYWVSKGFLERC